MFYLSSSDYEWLLIRRIRIISVVGSARVRIGISLVGAFFLFLHGSGRLLVHTLEEHETKDATDTGEDHEDPAPCERVLSGEHFCADEAESHGWVHRGSAGRHTPSDDLR